jgi:hypothetical protein
MYRIVLAVLCLTVAPSARAATYDETIPPGANYDKAEFRLWLPEAPGAVRSVVILVPGSNGDGRGQVDDPFWQTFAATRHLALVGCRFTDKQHEQMFIEHYVECQGSGQALTRVAQQEIEPCRTASAPLLLGHVGGRSSTTNSRPGA